MNNVDILNQVRRLVVSVTEIDPVSELKVTGANFDNSQKSFWVEEHLIGGDLRTMTNRRTRVSSYLIQYDFCCPAGKGMDELETHASAIENNLLDVEFSISGAHCIIQSIALSRNEGKLRNSISVLLTLAVYGDES